MENKKKTEDTHFSTQSQPIGEFVKSHKLPISLKYDKQQELDPQLVSPEFDPEETLLLHSTGDVVRIHARGAHFNSNSKYFEDIDYDVAIDEIYQGWFAVFGDPDALVSNPVVSHYRKVSQLAISPCSTFLVSGDQPLEAMKVERQPDGSKMMKPCVIPPGTVLTKEGIYTLTSRIKIRKNLLKKKVIKKEEMHVSCRDDMNNELLIPCHAQGIFYVLTQTSGKVRTPVMQMADIVSRWKFPVLVKLVHGQTAERPPSCKGTFVLLKSLRTKIGLASSVFVPQPKFFEIEVDVPIRFFSSPITLDPEKGNEYSQTLQTYGKKLFLSQQALRYRCHHGVQALTSARSSSTSGHGSGLSDDDEKFDWSKVSPIPNTPFLEHFSISKEDIVVFTYHNIPPVNNPQNPHEKKKRTNCEAKSIQRTKMYDSPMKATIPITIKQQSSLDSVDEALGCTIQQESGVSISPKPSPSFNRSRHGPTYGHLWSDSSSVSSDGSLDFIVENVSMKSVSAEDANYYNDSLSEHLDLDDGMADGSVFEPDTSVHIENVQEPITNTEPIYEEAYDTPSLDNRISGRNRYCKLVDQASNKTVGSEVSDALEDEEHIYHSVDYGAFVYEGYTQPEINKTHNGYYENVEDGSTNGYEKPENLFKDNCERAGPNDPYFIMSKQLPIDNTVTSIAKTTDYVKRPTTTSNSRVSNSQNRDTYVEPSPPPFGVGGLPTRKEVSEKAEYINVACLKQNNSTVTEMLMSNLKNLGLKPATEEAIKNIDINAFETITEDDDTRTRLDAILPGINRIDLNKISLFLESK